MQAVTAADAIEKAGGGKYLKHHFAAITEPGDSVLRKFANSIGAPVLDHPTDVGGRYSVLIDVRRAAGAADGHRRDGVARRRARTRARSRARRTTRRCPRKARRCITRSRRTGSSNETVLWAYADRLDTFHAWWRQLWAESLGKDGKGSTPVGALGPVDQHSQLQLFRDGPGNVALHAALDDDEGRRDWSRRWNAPRRSASTISRARRWAISSPPRRARPPRR